MFPSVWLHLVLSYSFIFFIFKINKVVIIYFYQVTLDETLTIEDSCWILRCIEHRQHYVSLPRQEAALDAHVSRKYPHFLPSSCFSFQCVQQNSPGRRRLPTLFGSFLWCSWDSATETLISQQRPTSLPLQLHPSQLYVRDLRTESWLHESHCLLCHVMLSASLGEEWWVPVK